MSSIRENDDKSRDKKQTPLDEKFNEAIKCTEDRKYAVNFMEQSPLDKNKYLGLEYDTTKLKVVYVNDAATNISGFSVDFGVGALKQKVDGIVGLYSKLWLVVSKNRPIDNIQNSFYDSGSKKNVAKELNSIQEKISPEQSVPKGVATASSSLYNVNFSYRIINSHPNDIYIHFDYFLNRMVLLTTEFTDLEIIEAIELMEADYQKHLGNESSKKFQLWTHLSDQNSIYGKGNSFCGKNHFLNEIKLNQINKELHSFIKDWISSDVGGISVGLANELGESTKKLIEPLLKKIPFKNVEGKTSYSNYPHPYPSKTHREKLIIVPVKEKTLIPKQNSQKAKKEVKNVDSLTFKFFLPKMSDFTGQKPLNYITSVLSSNSGDGTFSNVLLKDGNKNEQVFQGVMASSYVSGDFFSTIEITILMKSGYMFEPLSACISSETRHTEKDCQVKFSKYILRAVSLLSAYLGFLRSCEPLKWLYDEKKLLANENFLNKTSKIASSHVTEIAENLNQLGFENILKMQNYYSDFDKVGIGNAIKQLTFDNGTIMVTGFGAYDEISHLQEFSLKLIIEPTFNTEYLIGKFSHSFLEAINYGESKNFVSENKNIEFDYPIKNIFIPSNFDMITPKESHSSPKLILTTNLSKFWVLNTSDKFKIPKVNLLIYLSPNPQLLMNFTSSKTLNLFHRLWADIFNRALKNTEIMLVKASCSLKAEYFSNTINNNEKGQSGVGIDLKCYSGSLKPAVEALLDNLSQIHNFSDKKMFEESLEKQFSLSEKRNLSSLSLPSPSSLSNDPQLKWQSSWQRVTQILKGILEYIFS